MPKFTDDRLGSHLTWWILLQLSLLYVSLQVISTGKGVKEPGYSPSV